jgi:hypothetical protein
MRPRHVFGGGLIFFIVGAATGHPIIIGFALTALVSALIYKANEAKSAGKE